MPFVAAKCTSCGSNVSVDATMEAAICEFCGTPFIVEKAINHFNVTNHISDSVVNIYGGDSPDFVIRAGILEKYNGASTQVIIPDAVVIIGEKAFAGCSALSSVALPDGIKEIGPNAFYGCASLTSVALPDGIKEIGSHAFHGCASLTSIVLPNSIAGIGQKAFYGCKALKSIEIPDSCYDGIQSGGYRVGYVDGSDKKIGPFSGSGIEEVISSPRIISLIKSKKIMDGTPYMNRIYSERIADMDKMRNLILQGRCPHCEGELNLFATKCKQCGKPPI